MPRQNQTMDGDGQPSWGVPLQLASTAHRLFTEALQNGWESASGRTDSRKGVVKSIAKQHINLMEMRATFIALTVFLERFTGHTLVLMTDNVLRTAYLNK